MAKKSTVKRKTTAKKRTTTTVKKRTAAKKRTTAVSKPRRTSPKSAGLSGRSKLAIRQLSLVKAARKEGENTAKKRLLKQITSIFKSGKKRKPAAKRTKRVDSNPFEGRRGHGGRKKKETAEQRLKRVSREIYSSRDQILYGIANGSFKFKWASVAKETGYGEGERKKMLSILDNKGYTINQLAKKIWEDNDGGYGRGNSDDVIRDEIIDVLQSVSSRGDALNQLDRGQGDTPF